MKLTTAMSTLGLLTFASAAPITSFTSSTSPRALGDGTVNVARAVNGFNVAKFELVDDSSHFSVGKRTLLPLKRAVPIEHLDDPAVGKTIDREVSLTE
jgi:hypothetical protein